MICVDIKGGLGNQMLQLAAGAALSRHRNTELVLDTSLYQLNAHSARETARPLELAQFPAVRELRRLPLPPGAAALARRLPTLRRPLRDLLRRPDVLRLRGYRYADCYRLPSVAPFFALADGSYVSGYFFSEQYFTPYADDVRRLLAFPPLRLAASRGLADRIAAVPAVSVHVRRGDYTGPAGRAFAGVCDLDYYRRALAAVGERVDDPHYFVFSDDIPWCRANLPAPAGHVTFVDHTDAATALDDLQLMSRCRHHVIANSTFSWWGAWLDPQPDKLVVAPARWYAEYTGPSEDLIVPAGWLRV